MAAGPAAGRRAHHRLDRRTICASQARPSSACEGFGRQVQKGAGIGPCVPVSQIRREEIVMAQNALGMIETKGYGAALSAAGPMVKTAKVALYGRQEVGDRITEG